MKESKLLLLLMTAVTLVISACSSDEAIDSHPANNVITFNVLQDNTMSTRGTAIDATNLTTMAGNFDVWAYNGENLYLGKEDEGVKIKYKTSNTNGTAGTVKNDGSGYWDYENQSEVAFWPTENVSLSFYAINPSTSVENGVTPALESDSRTFSYTVNDNAEDQVDVMSAFTTVTEKPTDLTVTLPFRHALSQIEFLFKVTSGTKAIIKEIMLYNIKNNGTWTFQSNSGDNPTCEAGEETSNYTYFSSDEGEIVTSVEKTALEGAETLLLVPQQLDKANIKDNTQAPTGITEPYFSVKYCLSTNDDPSTELKPEKTYYFPLKSTAWLPGHKYVYGLNINSNTIRFSCDVGTWTN